MQRGKALVGVLGIAAAVALFVEMRTGLWWQPPSPIAFKAVASYPEQGGSTGEVNEASAPALHSSHSAEEVDEGGADGAGADNSGGEATDNIGSQRGRDRTAFLVSYIFKK